MLQFLIGHCDKVEVDRGQMSAAEWNPKSWIAQKNGEEKNWTALFCFTSLLFKWSLKRS